jgi:sialic acid synthase SpsE
MGSMTERYGCPVGLSDHTEGIHVASAAVALGACIIEKHFTTDRQRPGPDHSFALEPDGLAAMVSHIRDVERALGDGRRDRNTTGDRDQIARVTVRAVARRAIHPGQTVTAADVLFRRAPTGLSAREFEAMGSAIAVEAIAPLSPITEDKLRQIEK